jgi:hypothetical protein
VSLLCLSLTAVLKATGAGRAADAAVQAEPAAGPKIVEVDCGKGKKISGALKDKPDELVIRIKGVCHEDVVIDRGSVTLISDPESVPYPAEIHGVGVDDALGSTQAVVKIVAARRVRLENLLITAGSRFGVWVNESLGVELVGVTVSGSGRDGVQSVDTSNVFLSDSTIRDSGRYNLASFDAELTLCTRCTLLDGGVGQALVIGGRLTLSDSLLAGDGSGVEAFAGSSAWVNASSVTAGTWAFVAQENSSVVVARAGSVPPPTFAGSIFAALGGDVVLDGVEQCPSSSAGCSSSGAGGASSLGWDGRLLVVNGSRLSGPVDAAWLSQVTLTDGAALESDLTCSGGADAFCDDPSLVAGTVTGCARCVQPLAGASSSARALRRPSPPPPAAPRP